MSRYWPASDCDDILPGAIPQKLGTFSSQWYQAQQAQADKHKWMIYQYQWQGETSELSNHGKQYLTQLASSMTQHTPLYVESSGNPVLDTSRKEYISTYLQETLNVSNVKEIQIQIDSTIQEGLHGSEVSRLQRGWGSAQSRGNTRGL
ncbi:MAG: hypothetical protein MPJ24_10405 [Pirellulaceae bacterium]|nr:hypothetical protein [Pirellulaceae bacterium]